MPQNLRNLTKLRELDLSTNNLQGDIPFEFGNFHNMEVLSLAENKLTGSVPDTIFNISTLQALSLLDNKLSGSLPPNSNFRLPNLEWLQLRDNSFIGTIPSFITNASKLSFLELQRNSFTGFIPYTIGNLRNLKWLLLYDNYLTSTPDLSFFSSLTNCKKLEHLDLSSNPLNGIIPISVGNLSVSLTEFTMSDCNISGRIPQEIGLLKNLTSLNLGKNQLSGTIPSTIGWMQGLQGLYLHYNKLEGSIPTELCYSDTIFELSLNDNKLSGPIPTCFGNLSSLEKLFLDSNKLNSNIPSTLWSLRDILILNLSSNFITGSLSSEIENLKVAITIDLSSNQLSGKIPSTLGSLNYIQTLSLKDNRLQGSIPKSFGHMIALVSLDLSNNNLSGVIPKSMEALKYLNFVNLSFNRLEGEIPKSGAFKNLTVELFKGNIRLCDSLGRRGPPCKYHSHKKSRILEILLSIFLPLGVVLTLITLVILRSMKQRKKLSYEVEISLPTTWRRISYDQLMHATNGFSEVNMLGSGSFGSVYRGRLQDGTEIAVKVFHLQLEGANKSFDVECEVLSNIRHRNLIKIISSCSNDGFKALILEYMPNGNLDKYLYSHNVVLDILQRLNIMIDVALALKYLHFDLSTSIAHCDLKPSNVLLDEDMVAHLCDFGIAKLLGDRASMTQTQIVATIGYMAPEYGREGKVSRKGDVYSYGIMLMEIFTRKKPIDDCFTEEKSIKQWVSDSLHGLVTKVVDANLLRQEDEHFAAKEECMFSILSLALDCTHEVPMNRVDMKYVVSKLVKIKALLLAKMGTPRRG